MKPSQLPVNIIEVCLAQDRVATTRMRVIKFTVWVVIHKPVRVIAIKRNTCSRCVIFRTIVPEILIRGAVS